MPSVSLGKGFVARGPSLLLHVSHARVLRASGTRFRRDGTCLQVRDTRGQGGVSLVRFRVDFLATGLLACALSITPLPDQFGFVPSVASERQAASQPQPQPQHLPWPQRSPALPPPPHTNGSTGMGVSANGSTGMGVWANGSTGMGFGQWQHGCIGQWRCTRSQQWRWWWWAVSSSQRTPTAARLLVITVVVVVVVGDGSCSGGGSKTDGGPYMGCLHLNGRMCLCDVYCGVSMCVRWHLCMLHTRAASEGCTIVRASVTLEPYQCACFEYNNRHGYSARDTCVLPRRQWGKARALPVERIRVLPQITFTC